MFSMLKTFLSQNLLEIYSSIIQNWCRPIFILTSKIVFEKHKFSFKIIEFVFERFLRNLSATLEIKKA